MKRSVFLFLALACCVASVTHGWTWFGLKSDENEKDAPPRLHRLLEAANNEIEEAEDAALSGDAERAVERYKAALKELARIQAENPERAATPEFAPVRNRVASCRAAIEALRFEQISHEGGTHVVSDTTELQAKFDAAHGRKTAATNAVPARVAVPPSPQRKVVSDRATRLARAETRLRAGAFDSAVADLRDFLETHPDDHDAMLYLAASQCGKGNFDGARHTLERIIAVHPQSHLAYYNLALVALRTGEGQEAARDYYELGRAIGGPRHFGIEKKVGLK